MISPAVDRQNVASKGASTQSASGDADRQTSIDQCAAVFRREESRSAALATALCASGIDATPVASADALCVLVEAKRVKLLILDNQMGGFFTGMEVLQEAAVGTQLAPGHRPRRRQARACQRGENGSEASASWRRRPATRRSSRRLTVS